MHAKRLLTTLVLPTLLALGLTAQDTKLPQGAGDPPDRAARLSAMAGDVSFQPSGADDWSAATTNFAVTTGDRLYVGPGGRAELEVGAFAVRAAPGTDLTVTTLTDGFAQFGLAQGTLRLSVVELAAEDTIEVDTPHGAISVLAPGSYRIETAPDGSAVLVSVDRGSLEVEGGDTYHRVGSGQTVQLTGTDYLQVMSVAASRPDGFDAWSADRDRRLSSSGSAQYVSRDIPGYDDLDEAGRWDVDAEYGPVWYPTAVAADWAPYRYGRWVWVEPWGWTWVDDAPWGFAPFHYGRWVQVRSAWAWLPGPVIRRPYYSPALVVFVDGSGFGGRAPVQAWFPLGPGEPYFPSYHHGDDYQRRVNSTNIRGTLAGNFTNSETVQYRYRGAATVVPTDAFQRGDPVGARVVRVRPDQLAGARVTPHAGVTPNARSEVGGRPQTEPPVGPRPPMIVGRNERRPTPGQDAPPKVTGRGAPPEAPVRSAPPSAPERLVPPPKPDAFPDPRRDNPEQSQPGRMPLITRRQPAPQSPPFAAREPAMQTHGGRPLEPQQIDSLRRGRPAGPMRDPETPAHSAPPSRGTPATRAAPSAEPASKPGRNQRPAPPADSSRGRPRGNARP